MRRLTLRLDLLLLCFLLTAATTVTAQIRDLTTLQERRVLLGKSSDSLMSVCIRLVASKDSLSALAESLWSQDPESAELLLTRSASRVLVARLQVVERRLDSLATASDSLEADLRDSYDWEISRLMGAYWVQFAKTGNPNRGDLPEWPAFDDQKGSVLEIGDEIRPLEYPLEDRVQFHMNRGLGLMQKARK